MSQVRPSIDPENLELPPLNDRVVNQFIARLRAAAIAICDTEDCTTPAAWGFDYHGCQGMIACPQHKRERLIDVNRQLAQGVYQCMKCGEVFTNIVNIFKAWQI